MPQQTVFFEQQIGEKRIVVFKSYDKSFARESFDTMMPEALDFLQKALGGDPADLSNLPPNDRAEFLWEEIDDGAREDWNRFSYFIVCEESAGKSLPLFVSSDWPSAERFAKQRSLVTSH